ncbi:MAG: response regulator transcription factor [Verrucomicrobiota bacterium]
MKAPPPIRLVIVDDSELVRAGLRLLLGEDPGLSIAGEAGNVADGVELCLRLRPDVTLLDIRLPDGTGLDACREILRRAPGVRVLMLTSAADDRLVDEAVAAGAHGYLLKEIDAPGLRRAIRDVAAGRSVLDPRVTARVLRRARGESGSPGGGVSPDALSPQEQRILALIAKGCTNKEAAAELGLSEKTVKNYLSTVFDKLHVSRRAEAAAVFVQHRPGL